MKLVEWSDDDPTRLFVFEPASTILCKVTEPRGTDDPKKNKWYNRDSLDSFKEIDCLVNLLKL